MWKVSKYGPQKTLDTLDTFHAVPVATSIHATTSEDLTISKISLENDAENISRDKNSNKNLGVENIIQHS